MSGRLRIVGMIVVLLGLLCTSTVHAASPPLQGEGEAYVVQADDWLSKLAEKYLGNGNLWNRIVEATNSRAATDPSLAVIENPDLIYPGQIIIIPSESPVFLGVVKPVAETESISMLCQDQHPAVRALCSEIPIARIHFDPYAQAEFFTCASRSGISSVPVDLSEVAILVPNDGDFDLNGVVAAIKVTQVRASLIPRWPGSKFDFSAAFADRYQLPAGEQTEISLAKAFELAKAGELIWTGKHGVPGKAGLFQTNPVLTCDPQADFKIEIGPFKPKG